MEGVVRRLGGNALRPVRWPATSSPRRNQLPTQSFSRTVSAQPVRSGRSVRQGSRSDRRSVLRDRGQPEVTGWVIRIPEIGCATRASRRAAVEPVARKYIAALTGIPIGYITVYVRV